MSTTIPNSSELQGTESLTVGERLSSFFKELSIGVDAFNAKNFNKSIHTVDGVRIWKELADKNVYFEVSTKHIPTPVFFNPTKISFKEFVEFVLKAVPILKLADQQTETVYRGLKSVAASGKVPFSLSNYDNTFLINETRAQFKNVFEDTRVYTRAVNEVYSNFTEAFDLTENFNTIVKTLNSRDVEVLAKRADNVVDIVKLIKMKIDANEIILNPKESELLNGVISNLVDNINFAGQMMNQLSEMTRVLSLQTQEAKKL